MKLTYYIYYVLLLIALIVTIGPARKDKRIWFFFAVLASSLAEELLFEVITMITGHEPFIIYHLYAPIYYALFAWYFYSVIPWKKVRILIPYSIGFYVGGSVVAYFNGGGLFVFPGLKLDILGFLLIPLCLVTLYTLNVQDLSPVYKRPVFWISMSTFIFYSSDFIVIALKAYLTAVKETSGQTNDTIRWLNFINNYLYYLLIIIGMLCSRQTRKSLSP